MSRQRPQGHESFYKSSRARTLTIIIVGVLALSGVGVLAGAMVNADKLPLDGETLGTTSSDIPRPAAPRAQAPSPSPIGSPIASPSEIASPSPLESPTGITSPLPSPSPTDVPPPPTGETVVLDGGTVAVPLPAGWSANVGPDGLTAYFFDGQGEFIFLQVAQVDPTQNDAAGLITLNALNFLPPEFYTQLEQGEVTSLPPFGNILSAAVMAYRAVYIDSQSSFPLFGNMWIAVRQDGKTLIATAESTPETRFQEELWRPIIDPAFNSFAFPGQ